MPPKAYLHSILMLILFSTSILKADITVHTDVSTAYYEAGESMQFVVESDDNEPIEWWIVYGDFADTISMGTITDHVPNVASYIDFILPEPGFVFCLVEQDFDDAMTAAAFSPHDILLSSPAPNDFDSFWQSQKDLLAQVAMDPDLELESDDEYVTTYRISLANIDNRKVYGFISIPKGTGPYPASLTLPPFGSSANIVQSDRFTAERAGMIAAAITIHNAEPGTEDPDSYEPDVRTDREGLYYRYAILGAIRMIDYIYSRDDFDGENVCLIGGSQGAGLSLLVGGIDQRTNLLLQSIAALSAHGEFTVGKASGFPYYGNYSMVTNGTSEHFEQTMEAVSYYDAVFGAERFTGASYNFTSYQDLTCPPATGFAAFNALPGPKIMVHSIDEGHSSPSEFTNARYDFFRRHYEATQTPPWPFSDSSIGYYIDAGTDRNTVTGAAITLEGSYDKDGDIPQWPINWEVISGPDGSSISNAETLNPVLNFEAAGDYKLRLIVTDPYPSDNEIFYQLVDYVNINVIEGQGSPVKEINFVEAFIELNPNPTTDLINVNFEWNNPVEYELNILDLQGRIFSSQKRSGKIVQETIDVSDLSAGSYYVELKQIAGSISSGFIKN